MSYEHRNAGPRFSPFTYSIGLETTIEDAENALLIEKMIHLLPGV